MQNIKRINPAFLQVARSDRKRAVHLKMLYLGKLFVVNEIC